MSITNKILIIFAHPSPASTIDKIFVDCAKKIDHVRVRDLYTIYPDFIIDNNDERILLNESNIIIFQYPLHWYSCPSILKEWIDSILENYSSIGKRLPFHGKKLLSVVTTRGTESNYKNFTMRQLLSPFEALAQFCEMEYLDPLIFFNSEKICQEQALEYRRIYKNYILKLLNEGGSQSDMIRKATIWNQGSLNATD